MDGALLITGVISLIVLIMFFVLVGRVGAIKTLLEQRSNNTGYAKYYEQGELDEFLGKKEAAKESFRSSLFLAQKIKAPSDSDKRNMALITKKLEEYA